MQIHNHSHEGRMGQFMNGDITRSFLNGEPSPSLNLVAQLLRKDRKVGLTAPSQR